jgi:hypothetical protein
MKISVIEYSANFQYSMEWHSMKNRSIKWIDEMVLDQVVWSRILTFFMPKI